MAKILLSIPDGLLKDFDAYAEDRNYERSELIRELIRDKVYPKDMLVNQKAKEIEHITSTMPPKIEGENIGWCELHFEKGVTYPRKLITWEDENGTPVVNKKFACPKCVEKYENMGRGRVFYL